MSIISRIDWAAVDLRTRTEQARRERYAPWVGVFRWWARRPSSVVGAILDAGQKVFGSKYVVSDVFSGGGTVGFEAASRGLPLYAQDLYPWPANGLATGLRPICPDELRDAADDLLESLKPLRRMYAINESAELSHVLRVRYAPCATCGMRIYLFRRGLISLRSRSPGERLGFHGCASCGQASLKNYECKSFTCEHCSRKNQYASNATSGKPLVKCPHCNSEHHLAELLNSATLNWAPVLIQEVLTGEKGRRTVITRTPKETDPVHETGDRVTNEHLRMPIPKGVETDCLLRDGYRVWADVFTNRQLTIMDSALMRIASMNYSDEVLARLKVAVIGSCEMAGYLSRWEAHYPKAFEATANHRYARVTLAAETNLLSDIGRGTLPRRLIAAHKAASWRNENTGHQNIRIVQANGKRRPHTSGALVVVGSSTRQLLSDKQADLILTDPPYHDDVQYGELARLFHAWLAASGSNLPVAEAGEAVPNRHRKTDTLAYRDTVAACLKEGNRTLTDRGRMVLTYHNNDLKAWYALGQALQMAGFRISALAVAEAENAADHSKRNRNVFLHDLVIECAPSRDGGAARKPRIFGNSETTERRNLFAVGFAIAKPSSLRDFDVFKSVYATELDALKAEPLIR